MPFEPGLTLREPPRNSTSGMGARTIRGPTSVYLDGRRSCHTLGGSTTWSSTEMIFGRGSGMGIERSPHLTERQIGGRAAARPETAENQTKTSENRSSMACHDRRSVGSW